MDEVARYIMRHHAPSCAIMRHHAPSCAAIVACDGTAQDEARWLDALEDITGYLVRIAVHNRAQGRGVGVRLLAEAVEYFARAGVTRILLNTQEDNVRAHRLYEWFGFDRVEPSGFVLGRPIASNHSGA